MELCKIKSENDKSRKQTDNVPVPHSHHIIAGSNLSAPTLSREAVGKTPSRVDSIEEAE
jgi:hypothetical protein